MSKVNFLERKIVIQLFGVALLLAPLFNTVIMMATHTEIPNRWSWAMFSKLMFSGPTSNLVLYFFSVAIGLLMLRGAVSSWKYVLVLLGANIAMQVSHFEKVRSSQITAFFFAINSSLFLLVAYFFVWKQPVTVPTKAPAPLPTSHPGPTPETVSEPKPITEPVSEQIPIQTNSQPLPPPPVYEGRKKIVFQFQGLSPWAELINVSKKGFQLRSIAPPPADVTVKDIEITLKNGLILRGRLARQLDSVYFFEYQNLQGGDIRLLNEWLKACA